MWMIEGKGKLADISGCSRIDNYSYAKPTQLDQWGVVVNDEYLLWRFLEDVVMRKTGE